MVTSREPLSIYGEQAYNVPSLSIPDLQLLESTQQLLMYESIQLFYQRAKAVKPDFSINDENISAIAEICVRLDGLPLAIELAAARSNLYYPEMIRKRLGSRLVLLISALGMFRSASKPKVKPWIGAMICSILLKCLEPVYSSQSNGLRICC